MQGRPDCCRVRAECVAAVAHVFPECEEQMTVRLAVAVTIDAGIVVFDLASAVIGVLLQAAPEDLHGLAGILARNGRVPSGSLPEDRPHAERMRERTVEGAEPGCAFIKHVPTEEIREQGGGQGWRRRGVRGV